MIRLSNLAYSERTPANIRASALERVNSTDYDPATAAGASRLVDLFYHDGAYEGLYLPETDEGSNIALKVFEAFGESVLLPNPDHLKSQMRREASPLLAYGHDVIKSLEFLSQKNNPQIAQRAQAVLETFKQNNPSLYTEMTKYVNTKPSFMYR